jgi:Fuc2NAc and GlcNAc transferase
MTSTLLIVLTGFASLFLTARVRAYALRNDVLDRPNERSSHTAPTPRGGGLAMLVAALVALAVGVLIHIVQVRHALALAPGIAILGVIGWLDDHGGLSARVRLAAHLLAAVIALAALGGVPEMQVGIGTVHLGIFGSVFAAIGIVWSINLFNFMDGIDGIAGSQALLIFGIMGELFHLRGDESLAIISGCFAAASAGFLYWNWPPARIFMGDVASGALGFMIAALAIAGERGHSVPITAVSILGGVFVGDATLTLVRRLRRGERPADAHRDHAYQRIARAWGSHRPVTVAAAGLTLLLGLLAAAATLRPQRAIASTGAAVMLLLLVAVAAERRAPM